MKRALFTSNFHHENKETADIEGVRQKTKEHPEKSVHAQRVWYVSYGLIFKQHGYVLQVCFYLHIVSSLFNSNIAHLYDFKIICYDSYDSPIAKPYFCRQTIAGFDIALLIPEPFNIHLVRKSHVELLSL